MPKNTPDAKRILTTLRNRKKPHREGGYRRHECLGYCCELGRIDFASSSREYIIHSHDDNLHDGRCDRAPDRPELWNQRKRKPHCERHTD